MLKLRFASLLHDIGKFWQRTWDYPDKNHSELGAIFAKENGLAEVEDIILNHHSPSSAKDKHLAEIIQKADWISSKERKETEESKEVRKEPLQSIFSIVDIGKGKKDKSDGWFYRLYPLDLKKEVVFPADDKSIAMGGKTLDHLYRNLWNKGFLSEIDKVVVKKNKSFFLTLYNLIHKYTSYIPSAAWKSEPDISLFDHLRTTCGIAECLYKTKGKEKFLLLGGDISGIQGFIYDIFSPDEAQEGMSKRLRGRSFYLSLLTETLAHYILNSLNLTTSNLLWCGGGEFRVLLPDDDEVKENLSKIKKDINSLLFQKFNGKLYLALEYVVCDGDSLQNSFPQLLEDVVHKLSIEKQRKFLEIFDKNLFEKYPSRNVCRICGKDIGGEDERFCDDCIRQEEIGGLLPKTQYLLEINCDGGKIEYETSLEFPELKIYWKLETDEMKVIEFLQRLEPERDKIDSIVVYRLNDTDFLTKRLCGYVNDSDMPVALGFKFLGNITPFDGRKVLSFSEIAEKSEGIDLLSVLRMDIDDLGAIFAMGLRIPGYATMSRVATLSRLLDLFFSGYLNKICEEYKEDDVPLHYITYSGGDDLFIVGPWDKIMELALKINDEFRRYTCGNPNFTLSAGVFNLKPKFPIGMAANLAGEKLDRSKILGKDSITVFEETVKWESESNFDRWNGYRDLLNYGKKLEEYVEKKHLSKSFIYSILDFWRETFYEEWREKGFISLRSAIEKRKYVPHFKYLLVRSVDRKKEEEVFDDLDKNIPKVVPWARVPVSWVSLRERGGKNE